MVSELLNEKQLVSLIIFFAGALISLACSYFPKFNVWYASLESKYKQLLQLGFNALGALVIVGLSCSKMVDWIVCSTDGFMFVVQTFVNMILGNQVVYLLTPQTPSVKRAKENAEMRREKRRRYPID